MITAIVMVYCGYLIDKYDVMVSKTSWRDNHFLVNNFDESMDQQFEQMHLVSQGLNSTWPDEFKNPFE